MGQTPLEGKLLSGCSMSSSHIVTYHIKQHRQPRCSTMLLAQMLQAGVWCLCMANTACQVMCVLLTHARSFTVHTCFFLGTPLPSCLFQSEQGSISGDNLLVQDMVPSLEPLGLDLLSQMLRYEPQKRITARAAVKHPYFSDVAQMFAQRILVA